MVKSADKLLPKDKDVPIKILYGSVTGKAKVRTPNHPVVKMC